MKRARWINADNLRIGDVLLDNGLPYVVVTMSQLEYRADCGTRVWDLGLNDLTLGGGARWPSLLGNTRVLVER